MNLFPLILPKIEYFPPEIEYFYSVFFLLQPVVCNPKTNHMLPHQISLGEAIELTTRFRENPGPDMYYSETFDSASVLALLNQPGCKSFRIYLGRKPDDSICSVLVGADAEGHDILPPLASTSSDPSASPLIADDEGIILEDAFHCPPVCPEASPLNE